MGIIGSIRKHSGWAVAIVGIAIVAFIVGDLTKNGGDIPDMGKVNKETMTSQRFNELVAEREQDYRMQKQTSQVPADEEMRIRESVWEQFVEETLMEEQTSKLGLCVTSAEMRDMYTGKFIHPYVRQSFTDPTTGQFDQNQVAYWIEHFDQIDTTRRLQWIELEKAVRLERENQKYNTLISAGFYMPEAIAAKVAEYGSNTTNVRVAAQMYRDLADEEVQLTDADFEKYYNEHKAEFVVTDEWRDLKFVTFPVVPTAEDLAEIEKDVNKTWEDFQNTPDNEVAFFVNAVSDRPYDSSYVKASSLRAPFDSIVAASVAGSLIAPRMVDGNWMMAKVVKTDVRPDSLRASVVYVLNENAQRYGSSATRSAEQSKQLADSVLALLKGNKMTMEQAVEQYSDDPQKAEKMGDMDWQLDGNYGFLNEQLLANPVGSYFVLDDPRGIGQLVVKVTGKTPATKKYRVAMITRAITPSSATNRAKYTEASRFASQNRTLAAFEDAAREGNMQVRDAQQVTMMADRIVGIAGSRNIVQWAYNEDTKVGDVADQVYECDGQFVVVALSDIFKKGYATLEQVRPMIEQQVRIEKKAELLMARAEEAQKAVKDINSIAVSLKVTVDTIDSVSFADNSFGRYGMEPKVLGAVAASKEGLVGPVKGTWGVYTVQIDSKAPRATQTETVKAQLEQPLYYKTRMVSQVLRQKAKIVDQRNKFF
jgi:peptidyl-prolyl cis-trans isomerase D